MMPIPLLAWGEVPVIAKEQDLRSLRKSSFGYIGRQQTATGNTPISHPLSFAQPVATCVLATKRPNNKTTKLYIKSQLKKYWEY